MEDVADASLFLQDPEVMYAWEHDFTDDEVKSWVERSIEEHRQWGYSFMMARLKATGEPIGRAGLRRDMVMGKETVELGYILAKAYWGRGYATELGLALLSYGFDVLGLDEIVAEVRPDNLPSLRVVERLGMQYKGSMDKPWQGRSIRHDVFSLSRSQWPGNN